VGTKPPASEDRRRVSQSNSILASASPPGRPQQGEDDLEALLGSNGKSAHAVMMEVGEPHTSDHRREDVTG
jgi:hypothetical protein